MINMQRFYVLRLQVGLPPEEDSPKSERELNVPSMADGTFPVSLGFISHFHLGERFEIGPFRILEKKIH